MDGITGVHEEKIIVICYSADIITLLNEAGVAFKIVEILQLSE